MIRKLSILLIAVMIINIGAFSFSVEAREIGTSEKADVLLDLLLGDELISGEEVTRAEFTAAISRLFLLNNMAEDKSLFKDVSATDFAADEIYSARTLGFVDAADYFYPNEKITAGAAVKLAACFAGYKALAEKKGGYPSGYLKVALENDFLDGLGKDFYNKPLTAKDARILLYNVMLSDYVGIEGITEYKVSYKKYPSNLSVIHEIYIEDGILNASNLTSLKGEDRGLNNKLIEINGISYVTKADFSQYLGYNCTVFYSLEGAVKEALALYPDKNEETVLSLESIENINSEEIKFYDDKNNKSVRIKLDTENKSVIYNGWGTYFDTSLFDGDGTVTAVDNDRDGSIEVLVLNKYVYAKTQTISTSSGEIGFDANYGADSLVLDEDVFFTIKNLSGEELTIYDIEVEDYVGICKSENEKIVKLILLDKKLTGKLTAKDSAEKTIEIDGESYKYLKSFENDYGKLELGATYDFIRDENMNIVAADDTHRSFLYAYLVNHSGEETRLEKRKIKVFTEKNEMLILSCGDNVRIDGEKKTEKELFEKLADGTYSCPSLVKIKYSQENVLTHIDFSEEFDNAIDVRNLEEKNDLVRYTFEGVTEFRYRSGANSCMPYFNLKGTVVFKIPTDLGDEENYFAASSSTLLDNTSYVLDVYSINEAGSAGAVVLVDDSSQFSYHNNTYIVEKIRYGKNTDDIDAKIVTCWSLGKYYTFYLENSVSVNKDSGKGLCGGDIVRINADNKNNIKAITVDFDAESGIPVPNSFAGSDIFVPGNKSFCYTSGKLYSVKDGYAYLSDTKDYFGDYDYSLEKLMNCYINTRHIVKYDTEKEELRPIKQSELKTYLTHGNNNHYAVLRQNVFNINSVYIYE